MNAATVNIRVHTRHLWGLALARHIACLYIWTGWSTLITLANWCIRQTVIECRVEQRRWRIPANRMPQLAAD